LLGGYTGLHDRFSCAAIQTEQEGGRDDHGRPKDGISVLTQGHSVTKVI
jgi:hypothetical protein